MAPVTYLLHKGTDVLISIPGDSAKGLLCRLIDCKDLMTLDLTTSKISGFTIHTVVKTRREIVDRLRIGVAKGIYSLIFALRMFGHHMIVYGKTRI